MKRKLQELAKQINIEEFRTLLLDYNVDMSEIALKYGICKDSVYKLIKILNIELPKVWICPFCNKQFKSRVYWAAHVRVHEQIPYDKLIELLKQGLTLKQIAVYFGVKKSKVESAIRSVYKINVNRRNWIDKYRSEIIRMYEEGYSVNYIANLFGISEPSLRQKLKHWGVKLRTYQEQIKVQPIDVKLEQQKKREMTCLLKYGVNNPSKCLYVKLKIGKTSAARAHNNFALKIPPKTYKHLIYQGSYEFDFIKFIENNFDINKLQNFPNCVKYYDKVTKKIRWYKPDFIYDNKYVIEVKSSYVLQVQGGFDNLHSKFSALKRLGYIPILILDKDYSNFKAALLDEGSEANESPSL